MPGYSYHGRAVLFKSLLDNGCRSIENEDGPISRSNRNIFAAAAECSSVPIACHVEFVITALSRKQNVEEVKVLLLF